MQLGGASGLLQGFSTGPPGTVGIMLVPALPPLPEVPELPDVPPSPSMLPGPPPAGAHANGTPATRIETTRAMDARMTDPTRDLECNRNRFRIP